MTAAERPDAWLRPTPQGLWCEPGGFHIDPVQPVARAVVTQARATHKCENAVAHM